MAWRNSKWPRGTFNGLENPQWHRESLIGLEESSMAKRDSRHEVAPTYQGGPKIALRGGGGGMAWAPGEGGGGGVFQIWASVPGPGLV